MVFVISSFSEHLKHLAGIQIIVASLPDKITNCINYQLNWGYVDEVI